MDSPEAVEAAAGLFSGIVAAGHQPPEGMWRALVAAARVTGMLEHPSVLIASKWQDWLHPRGKDGRFIEKASFVNVFANPNALLTDRTADRRRAKIVELRPTGAAVKYQDINGDPLPPDPGAGFPALIPVDELSTKVSTAPPPLARLQPHESAAKEFKDAMKPALAQEQYDAEIARVNALIAEHYPEQAGIVSTGQRKISDEEFKSHLDFVAAVNHQVAFRPSDEPQKGVLGDGRSLTYDAAFKDSFGLWSEEMQQVFDAIVDEVYDDLTENQTKPRDHRAIVLGGLPGAGKTTTLEKMGKESYRPGEWIIANPDNFKDKMLERGLYPKVTGLTPAETSSFIHEASSEMNHMLEQLLTVEGYNVIFDITMGGKERDEENDWNGQMMKRLSSLGYAIDGIFVDVTTEAARDRVEYRHREGLDVLRTGTPARAERPDDPALKYGGRVVPESVIAAGEFDAGDPNSKTFNSQNARNFDRLKGEFTRWAVWDNGGKEPELLAGTAADVTDKANLPGYYPSSASGEGVA